METVHCEVTACSVQDTLDGVWFVDWVMREDDLEALRDGVLGAEREPFEECRVVIIGGDPTSREERVGDGREAPVIFQDIGLIIDAGLSREVSEGFEALLRVPRVGSDVRVKFLEMRSKLVPVSRLEARQSCLKGLQDATDVARECLNLLDFGESEAVGEDFIFTQEDR
jgi:hypothetical protein